MQEDDTKAKKELSNFRQLCSSYIEYFNSQKNHIYSLLGKKQSYSSGIFRENLIKDFLKKLLPDSISVDSGFLYGFGIVENSKQIDIIIWDSSNYGAIYKTDTFVIVPPEAVICIITVKSNMTKRDVIDGLINLSSIIDLENNFRLFKNGIYKERVFGAISKIFISFEGSNNHLKTRDIICTYYQKYILDHPQYAEFITKTYQNISPLRPEKEVVDVLNIFFVKLVLAVDSPRSSFYTGFGPYTDSLGEFKYGPKELKRLPFLYPEENQSTSQVDKMVYYILSLVYNYLNVKGWSTPAAWGDLNPITGLKSGDVYEIIGKDGKCLIDYDKL